MTELMAHFNRLALSILERKAYLFGASCYLHLAQRCFYVHEKLKE